MNDTASIARSVIESGDVSNTTNSNSSNSADHVDAAVQEMDALMADDPTNVTRRVAAAMTTLHDPRNFVRTKQNMIRREFNDTGDNTRRIAREQVDLSAFADGMKPNPKAVAALHLNEFASSVNAGTHETTLPTNASTEAIVDAILRHGRNAQ